MVDIEVGIVVTSISVSELSHSFLKLTQLAESASSRHQTPESSLLGNSDSLEHEVCALNPPSGSDHVSWT